MPPKQLLQQALRNYYNAYKTTARKDVKLTFWSNILFMCVTLQGNNFQQLISIESVDPLHCNKTKIKRDKNQGVIAMCKQQGIKKEGGSEECNKGTDWSAEVLDFKTT